MRRWQGRNVWRGVWLAVAMALVVTLRAWQTLDQPPEPPPLAEGSYRVRRVVDGDTLLLESGWRVRLIGVDTPETVRPNHPVEPWGKQATEFTQQFVRNGVVRLQLDRERLDRYDRLLAYVWVGQQMLNEQLLLAGLARARLEFRYSPAMKRRFARAEAEARRARRGIWSATNEPASAPATSTR